jgi:hypothetical protein
VIWQPTAKRQQWSHLPWEWSECDDDRLVLTLYLVDDAKGVSISNGTVQVRVNGVPLFYRCDHGILADTLLVRSVQPSYKRHKGEHDKTPIRVNQCVLPDFTCHTAIFGTTTQEDMLLFKILSDIALLEKQPPIEYLPTL